MRAYCLSLILLFSGICHAKGELEACDRSLLKGKIKLISGLELSAAKNKSFLTASEAKDWTPKEIELMRGWTNTIAQRAPGFVEWALKAGVKIYRFGYPFQARYPLPFTTYSRIDSPYYAVQSGNTLEIYDRFFEKSWNSSESWFATPEYILAHEFFHVADPEYKFSSSKEFLDLTGWEKKVRQGALAPESYLQIKNVDPEMVKENWAEVKRLNQENRRAESLALSQRFARPHGFPNLYSMTSPPETLAEIGAHVIFDPDAKKYMPTELLEYMYQNFGVKPQ